MDGSKEGGVPIFQRFFFYIIRSGSPNIWKFGPGNHFMRVQMYRDTYGLYMRPMTIQLKTGAYGWSQWIVQSMQLQFYAIIYYTAFEKSRLSLLKNSNIQHCMYMHGQMVCQRMCAFYNIVVHIYCTCMYKNRERSKTSKAIFKSFLVSPISHVHT